MKTCTICKIEKSSKEFYKDSRNKDGYNSNCKECTKKATYERYSKTKEDPVAYKFHLERIAFYKRNKIMKDNTKNNKDNYENM